MMDYIRENCFWQKKGGFCFCFVGNLCGCNTCVGMSVADTSLIRQYIRKRNTLCFVHIRFAFPQKPKILKSTPPTQKQNSLARRKNHRPAFLKFFFWGGGCKCHGEDASAAAGSLCVGLKTTPTKHSFFPSSLFMANGGRGELRDDEKVPFSLSSSSFSLAT